LGGIQLDRRKVVLALATEIINIKAADRPMMVAIILFIYLQ
jgi:hypothetical protein